MRLHVVFLVVLAIGVASSHGFFIKKAASSLYDVKVNLVQDTKAAIEDLKTSAYLKAKAVKGGLKAIGTAKLGLLKGIKSAKIGLLKGIAGAKLAKVAAIKAGKVAFVKTLVAAKAAPLLLKGAALKAIKTEKLALAGAPAVLQGLKDKVALGSFVPSLEGVLSRFRGSSSSSASLGSGNLALFPAPGATPTQINIVTYRNEAQSSSKATASASSGANEQALQFHAPSPSSAPINSYGEPLHTGTPAAVYGEPVQSGPPAASYGVPFRR